MTGSTIFNRQNSGSDQKKTNEKGQTQQVDGCKSENEPCSPAFLSMENAVPEVIEQSSKMPTVQYDSGTEDHSDFDVKSRTTSHTLFENDDDDAESSPCDPEEIHCRDASEQACVTGYQQTNYLGQLAEDLNLASQVQDNEKKDFCESTKVVFHADFVIKILGPIIRDHPGLMYYLFADAEIDLIPIIWHPSTLLITDNAKGQFKCDSCGHSWTSMRSRIVFKIAYPSSCSFISLKIFGQHCEHCSMLTHPLWYLDEVSRVMTNLAKAIFLRFFPNIFQEKYGNGMQPIQNEQRRTPYDPKQRSGRMRRPHDPRKCEACQVGCCFSVQYPTYS